MEKFTRDIQELTNLNQELASLSSSLAKQKDLMRIKPMEIFILDLQDYVTALKNVTNVGKAVAVTQEDPKIINGLLTRQNELMRIVQRDLKRILSTGDDAITLNAETLKRRVAKLDELITLNQFLLQDNLNFQSILESGELMTSRQQRRNFWQRLFKKTR